MRRFVIISMLLLALAAIGCCTWQANQSSTAVDVNPFNYGSGTPVVQPSNAPGYLNGQAFDMRSK